MPINKKRPELTTNSWHRKENIGAQTVVQFVLLLAAVILSAKALIGENGLIDALNARKQHNEIAKQVEKIRQENEELRERARRLREDPKAIEEVARGELGLVAPGELLLLFTEYPRHHR